MPHITEDTVSRLRERITEGARLVRRYWGDDSTPYGADFHIAVSVAFDADGWVTITYRWYTKGGARRVQELHYSPDDVVAVVDMRGDAYAHHDDRLTLPGGYMDAHPGTSHRVWDVYRSDGTLLAKSETVTGGRALLAEEAPEMIWRHHGDGKWTARGQGRHWRVERDGSNPDYDVHAPLSRSWFYTLSSRPLSGGDWQAVRVQCATPQEAREAAPAPQGADERS